MQFVGEHSHLPTHFFCNGDDDEGGEQKSQGKKELTKIAAARGAGALNLLAFETQKIDLVVGHDLTLLKFGQMLTTLPQHRCAQNLSNFG